MTTKEAIHQRIDELDEENLDRLMDFVDVLLSESGEAVDFADSDLIQVDAPAEQRQAQRDAYMSLIGMVRSEHPTNIREFKDDYIADSILHPDEP